MHETSSSTKRPHVVVIGGGSAGLVTSYIAAAVKAKVTLIEKHKLGGDCLNTGCVPSKALIRAARLAHEVGRAAEFGLVAAPVRTDFGAVMARVAQAVASVAPHDSIERYTALGVEVRTGRARLLDPWHVEITAPDGSTEVLSTRAVIIASGAAPTVPPLPGLADLAFLTSDTTEDVVIRTTFDQKMQKEAEKALAEAMLAFELRRDEAED